MAEVIDLKDRKGQEQKKLRESAGRRMRAVAGALACGLCPRRCSYCGLAIENPLAVAGDSPYPFCESCGEEYRAFKRRDRKSAEQEAFWHNEQWERMWRTWLEQMQAAEEFRRTPAFMRLMREYQD